MQGTNDAKHAEVYLTRGVYRFLDYRSPLAQAGTFPTQQEVVVMVVKCRSVIKTDLTMVHRS